MEALVEIVGAIIVIVTLGDVIATTTTVADGGGWISRRTTAGAWALWRHIAIRKQWLSHGGAMCLMVVFAQWTLLLWGGWILISKGAGWDWGGEAWHVLGLLIGRGSGPGDLPNPVRLAAGVSGVLLVSLSISYIVAVVSAVAYTRHVAAYLRTLGETPEEVLDRYFDEDGSDEGFDLHLIALTPMLLHVGTKFLAFPVLDAFQPSTADKAFSVRLAVFTLALSRREQRDGPSLPEAVEEPFIRAVDQLVAMYGHRGEDEEDEERGFEERLTELCEWVERAGWSWEDDVERSTPRQPSSEDEQRGERSLSAPRHDTADAAS